MTSTPKESVLRFENAADIPSIHEVVLTAFGRDAEANLVDALRRSNSLTLSVVAELEARVVGHIGYSPIVIGDGHEALALAPLAVVPDFQCQGIGTALVRWSLEECRRQGHRLVIVLGEPGYYGRFGFSPAAASHIECPFPVPSEAFMMLELVPNSAVGCRGVVRYCREFEAV
jgi:putative acetyltransferase